MSVAASMQLNRTRQQPRRLALFPHEDWNGQQMRPQSGRLDDVPRGMPPIFEQLRRDRMAQGRVGHFSSRNPLLGTTAEQDGAFPDYISRSTTRNYVDPMPHELYTHRRDAFEFPDQLSRGEGGPEALNWTTTQPTYLETERQLREARGGWDRRMDVAENARGLPDRVGPYMSFATVPNDPTNNLNFPMYAGGGAAELHQANVGLVGTEWLRDVKGGDANPTNARGNAMALTNKKIGLGYLSDMPISYKTQSLPTSGGAQTMVGGLYNVDRRYSLFEKTYDTRQRLEDVATSGGAQTVVPAPYRVDFGGLGEDKPTDHTNVFALAFGMDRTDFGFAADRFQTRRTQLFEQRVTGRDRQSYTNVQPNPDHFDRPPVWQGQETVRVTDASRDESPGDRLMDVGVVSVSTSMNPPLADDTWFYSRQGQSHSAGTRIPTR